MGYKEGYVKHEIDLFTGEETETVETDQALDEPHENVEVVEFSPTPPPTQDIDLPGAIDVEVSPNGLLLVDRSFQNAMDADVEADLALLGPGGLFAPAGRKPRTPRPRSAPKSPNTASRRRKSTKKSRRGNMFRAMTR